MKQPSIGDLRIWWIPQFPGKSFYVSVSSIVEGVKLLETLADYDIFQCENKIKPDYCNAGGLQIFEDDPDNPGYMGNTDWCDWCNDEFDDPKEFLKSLASPCLQSQA